MSGIRTWMTGFAAKILLLAILYVLTGKLGLLLAVPPGYATVIWPPSGIALGMLLVHGYRLWPGILIGSFLLNCHISGAYTLADGLVAEKMLPAFGIALGSTLQAIVGYVLVRRFVGLPLQLTNFQQVLRIFLFCGPLACLIAASVGIAVLHVSGVLPQDKLAGNWLAWWAGDIFGILVFLPLVLVAPGSPARLTWRNNAISGLPMIAMLVLIMPLGLTFYAWKLASESQYQNAQSEFETLAVESEQALLHRISSYENALLGGAGFFQGSEKVSRTEWRDYVKTIQLKDYFPGINGIGWIKPVVNNKLADYEANVRAERGDAFTVHPATDQADRYVITYIEPEEDNKPAVGLDIGFEPARRAAADMARDSGKAAITKRIVLVQDENRTPGFLLLHPFYRSGLPTHTTQERRAAFRGWIYAPFVAKNFLHNLTNNQGTLFNLRIYDGTQETPEALIYRSDTNTNATASAYTIRKTLEVMQQKWLIVWESTPDFEKQEITDSPLLILAGGLAFTGLFGIFLLVITVRRTETMEWMVGERRFALPLAIFALLSFGSYQLYITLQQKEMGYIEKLVQDEANKIELLIRSQTDGKLLSLKRLAQRWEVAGGTPSHLWHDDARNYNSQLSGLRTVQWVDASYRVRWIEPLEGNEKAVGLNIVFDEQRAQALKGAAEKKSPTLTPPLMLVQGYEAFIAYIPLTVHGKFDGFIAGIFAIKDFFGSTLDEEIGQNFAIMLKYEGKSYYELNGELADQSHGLVAEKTLTISDKQWSLQLRPTRQFVESEKTSLPLIVLLAGLIIAALSALSARAIMLARLQANYLQRSNQALKTSEETFRSAIDNASIGMALVAPNGHFLEVNQALCTMLGYEKHELLANDFQSITHPDDLKKDMEFLQRVLADEMKNYRLEKRYYHKLGRVIWIQLSVSLVRNADGAPHYFIAQIQDITEQKEMDRIKSEFISIVSHELRTPLTSIRGSLGLVLGALSKDLPEKVKGLINIAHNNCERLILLINDILDIDKIASGQMRFDMKDESLAAITREAADANEAYAQKFCKGIVVGPINGDIRIRVDVARYIQVLSNLLSNACKFSPPESHVEISIDQQKELVRITIRDHGPGIPKEFRSRIFGKFSQADSSNTRGKGGTGLGLHITKQMVEHMQGHIGFDTELDKGTRFWIEFPILHHTDLPLVEDQRDLPAILICEDDRTLAALFAEMVHQAGYSTTVAHTLIEARRYLANDTYSAITLDSILPDGKGTDFIRELRDQPSTREIPIIVIAGNEPDIDSDFKLNEYKVAAWLKKPIHHSELVDEVRKVIIALPTILHIEDDADLSHVLATSLQGKAELVAATTLRQAEILLRKRAFSLILLDIGMPDGSGLTIIDKAQQFTGSKIPVVVLSADLPRYPIRGDVAAVLEKSRVSETKIIETIMDILEKDKA